MEALLASQDAFDSSVCYNDLGEKVQSQHHHVEEPVRILDAEGVKQENQEHRRGDCTARRPGSAGQEVHVTGDPVPAPNRAFKSVRNRSQYSLKIRMTDIMCL
jgi:hypothetical protein